MSKFLRTLSFISALCACEQAAAQWNSNTAINTPVCVQQGNQRELRMLKDGKGGAYLVWKDYRAGLPDIYMQRISKTGVPKWAIDGVGVCTQAADQSTPAIVEDGSGGVIIVWSDWRSSIERDVYAQRVDSNGNMMWMTDGVVVTNKTNREHTPKMIDDDAGGAIIVWEQQTNGLWDLWAQHIKSDGSILWASGGIPLVTIAGNRINAKIEKDGKGGAIIAWQDERNGNYDIYAQRLDPQGNRKWGTAGIVVCSSTGTQNVPKIDPDSSIGGAYVVWVDKRNGQQDIYAQRIDSMGAPKWTANGVAVCTAAGSQSAQDIMSNDNTNGIFITWKDDRSGNYDIYAQKLSTAGAPQWTANGVAICTSIKGQVNPNIIQDNGSGAIIVWQDSSSGSYDIKAQKINASGNLAWPAAGAAVGMAAGDQLDAKNVSDGYGGSIIAWADERGGFETDIYVHHLAFNGTDVHNADIFTTVDAAPNPFKEAINITAKLKTDEPLEVSVLDMTGRNVSNVWNTNIYRINSGSYKVAISTKDGLATAGMYFIRLSTSSGSTTIKALKY